MRTMDHFTGGGRRSSRLRAVLMVLALVAASVLVTVVSAGPAQADCIGVGNPTTIILTNSSGQEIARETPQRASTCDGLSDYYGQVKDSRTDGSCAYARFFDPGQFTQGIECTTGAWDPYVFNDQQGNSSAQIQIATTYTSTPRLATWGF